MTELFRLIGSIVADFQVDNWLNVLEIAVVAAIQLIVSALMPLPWIQTATTERNLRWLIGLVVSFVATIIMEQYLDGTHGEFSFDDVFLIASLAWLLPILSYFGMGFYRVRRDAREAEYKKKYGASDSR